MVGKRNCLFPAVCLSNSREGTEDDKEVEKNSFTLSVGELKVIKNGNFFLLKISFSRLTDEHS
jgi:hypothetical protein